MHKKGSASIRMKHVQIHNLLILSSRTCPFESCELGRECLQQHPKYLSNFLLNGIRPEPFCWNSSPSCTGSRCKGRMTEAALLLPRNHVVTHDGKTITKSSLCEIYGQPRQSNHRSIIDEVDASRGNVWNQELVSLSDDLIKIRIMRLPIYSKIVKI